MRRIVRVRLADFCSTRNWLKPQKIFFSKKKDTLPCGRDRHTPLTIMGGVFFLLGAGDTRESALLVIFATKKPKRAEAAIGNKKKVGKKDGRQKKTQEKETEGLVMGGGEVLGA